MNTNVRDMGSEKTGKLKMSIATKNNARPEREQTTAAAGALSDEDISKDAFFVQMARLVEAMIAAHGKDFAIGTLVLAAKFVAEGKSLANTRDQSAGTESVAKTV